MIFGELFYSYPDSQKAALQLGSSFNPVIKGVQPWVYQSEAFDLSGVGAGTVTRYIDFENVESLANAPTDNRLFFGDVQIFVDVTQNVDPGYRVSFFLHGYPTDKSMGQSSENYLLKRDGGLNPFTPNDAIRIDTRNTWFSHLALILGQTDATTNVELNITVMFMGYRFTR